MAFDANGNWIPDPDPFLDMISKQAAPAPNPDPMANEPAPSPPAPKPAAMSDAQSSLMDRNHIKTWGPAADAANAAIGGYQAEEQGYVNNTGQGRPQQFGTEEPMRPDEGPLSPADAAEKYMANNPTREAEAVNVAKHTLGSRDPSRLAANAAYQARAEADAQARRERAPANRAAAREKDADMWSQFNSLNAIQGGGGQAQAGNPGGINVQRIGGYAFVGPHAGTSPWGPHGHVDPFAEQKLQLQADELARRTKKDANTVDIAGRKLAAGEAANKIKVRGLEDAMTRFKQVQGQKIEKTAQEDFNDLERLTAELDRRNRAFMAAAQSGDNNAKLAARDSTAPTRDPNHPNKTIPGVPQNGSYQAIQRAILSRVYRLDRAREKGVFQFDPNKIPAMRKMIQQITQDIGSDEPADEE